MAKRSVTIIAACITFSGLILAAVITAVFAPRHAGSEIRRKQTANEKRESPHLELTYSVTGAHHSEKEWIGVPLRDGTSLWSGDYFKVSFKTSEDCYVYVLLYGSAGIAQCLFPHEEIASKNYIKANVLYTVPEGSDWYCLDSVPGTETIYILACYEQMNNVQELLREMESADLDSKLAFSADVRQHIQNMQIQTLAQEERGPNQRGVSGIASGPIWDLPHNGKSIEAVTEIVAGQGSLVKVISFEHR
jgi:hypothetical protein